MPCACHFFNLIIQSAFDEMPSNIGFLASEVPSFFFRSILCREEFLDLFQAMNPNCQRSGTQQPFQKFCHTRWLLQGRCLYNLLVNWQEPKALSSMLQPKFARKFRRSATDSKTTIFTPLLCSWPQLFKSLNTWMHFSRELMLIQEKLITELNFHYKSFEQRVFDSREEPLPRSCMDLGQHFLLHLRTSLHANLHQRSEKLSNPLKASNSEV